MKVLKSVITVIVLLAFVGSTSGVQVYKHYCGDFLEAISVYIEANPCEGEGGEAMCSQGKTTSCCDDETEFYQLEVDFIKHSSNQQEFKIFPTLLSLNNEELIDFSEKKVHLILLAKPPPVKPVPIYKQLSQFIFYG